MDREGADRSRLSLRDRLAASCRSGQARFELPSVPQSTTPSPRAGS